MNTNPLLQREDENEKRPVCACCTATKLKYFALSFATVALLFLLFSLFLPAYIDNKLESGILDYISLSPDNYAAQTEGFRTWQNFADPDAVPVYTSFYIYNVSNPDEILQGAKPKVSEHGPYIYREIKQRVNISFTYDVNNKQVIQYKEWEYYVFDVDRTAQAAGTVLDPNTDVYTTFNFPFMAMWSAATGLGVDSTALVFDILAKSCPTQYVDDRDKLFAYNRTTNQILFGYSDDCITGVMLNLLKKPYPGLSGPNVTTIEEIYASQPYDSIYTGESDNNLNRRQYYSYAEQQYLNISLSLIVASSVYPIWGSPVQNRIRGTDGTQFHRSLQEGETLGVYVSEITREIPLQNVNNSRVTWEHIDLLHFTVDPKTFLNQTYVPDNYFYYMYNINGLLNLTASKSFMQVFMSKPHFLDADSFLYDAIDGLSPPDPQQHDTFLDVEPITGATMHAAKRLQVNYYVHPWKGPTFQPVPGINYNVTLNWFPNVTSNFIPVAWLEEAGTITSDKAKDFRNTVYFAIDMAYYIKYVSMSIGCVFLGIANTLYFIAVGRAMKSVRKSLSVTDSEAA